MIGGAGSELGREKSISIDGKGTNVRVFQMPTMFPDRFIDLLDKMGINDAYCALSDSEYVAGNNINNDYGNKSIWNFNLIPDKIYHFDGSEVVGNELVQLKKFRKFFSDYR